MATYNQQLRMWSATGPDGTRLGTFATQAEAEAAEAAGQGNVRADFNDEEFGNIMQGAQSGDSMIHALGPERTAEDIEADRAAREFRAEEERLRNVAYGTPVSQGGTATEHVVEQHSTGTINTTRGGIRNAPAEARVVTPGGGLVAPSSTVGANADRADDRTNDAEAASKAADEENEFQNESLWSENAGRIRDLGGAEYGLSDEARGYQREGLQQQRELLERLLGFDPNAYATQFGDKALARTIAAGRQGTSAAAQQAGMFAAMEQAPGLYAEGAREASALENQRLAQAANVSKGFGELGTMTRGQDETRAQFDAQLPVEIARLFNEATQGKMQLNEQESSRFAEVWMNFAELQSVYDRMSLDEQLAWWEHEMQGAQLEQQYKMFKEELKAQGKVTAKDLLGGLFQLGGGLLTGGFSIAAAAAGKK